MTTNEVFQVSNKNFRLGEPESDGYRPWIPCDANGKNVDRCPICGGHAHSHPGLHCGL